MAARVPATTRAVPRRMASQRRYRSAGPSPADSVTWLSGPSSPVSAASTRSRSRASGSTISAPRPAAAAVPAARAISSGHCGPGSADQTARGARPLASAARNAAPAVYRDHGPGSGTTPPTAQPATAATAGPGRPRRAAAVRPVRRPGCWPGRVRLLGAGVPRRDGQPQHVGHGARVAVGDLPGQGHDLRAQHRLGRDHPLQPGQPARVLAGRHPLQQVPVDELAQRTGRGPGSPAPPGRPAAPAPGSRTAGPGGPAGCPPPPGRPAAPPRRAQRPAAAPGPPGGPADCRLAAPVPADWLPLPRSCPTRHPGRPGPRAKQPRP